MKIKNASKLWNKRACSLLCVNDIGTYFCGFSYVVKGEELCHTVLCYWVFACIESCPVTTPTMSSVLTPGYSRTSGSARSAGQTYKIYVYLYRYPVCSTGMHDEPMLRIRINCFFTWSGSSFILNKNMTEELWRSRSGTAFLKCIIACLRK